MDILLYGVIGEDVTAADVKAQLAEADGDAIVVRIDSPGGSVFQGFSIFQAIESYQGPKSCVIESAAFSIASYIAMAPFDKVEIASNGYLMLHNPSKIFQGDDEEFEREAKTLKKLKDSMVAAYSAKSGIAEAEVAEMLKVETYLNAQEALEKGFVSRVLGAETKSRVVAWSRDLPECVFASLRGVATAGTEKPNEKVEIMSEKTEPVAASVADIKAAFPKAKADFILKCIEKQMPMASVASAAAEELLAENEALQAKIAAMEEEMESLKSSASAMEEEKEEQAKASAAAQSSEPIAQANGSQQHQSARERWTNAVAQYVNQGIERHKAVAMANRRNPGLRQQMLQEVNG